jgi:hypothetical protein
MVFAKMCDRQNDVMPHHDRQVDRPEKRFLSEIDTPPRDPKDIIFVNPEDGTPESSIGDNHRGDKA